MTLPVLRVVYCLPSRAKFILKSIYSKILHIDIKEKSLSRSGVKYTSISADTLERCLFLQGYLHAKRQAYQLEIYRRTARGTLSEIMGNHTLQLDKVMRALNIDHISHDDEAVLSNQSAIELKAYSDGINKYLSELNFILPHMAALCTWRSCHAVKVLPWRPADSLALLRLFSYRWSGGWEEQLMHVVHGGGSALHKEPPVMPQRAQGAILLPSRRGIAAAFPATESSSGGSLLGSTLEALVRDCPCPCVHVGSTLSCSQGVLR